jgi:magnesium chelatase family protein
MSLSTVYTRAQVGIESPLVQVEVHLSGGLPSLSLVGLPETAVKESKDRVRSAILNSHYEFPAKRITVLCEINRNKMEPLLCIEF